MNPKKLSVACLIAAISGITLVASPAQARRGWGDSGWYEQDYETKGPARGYSGSVWSGRRNYWCDYQRIPNRKCTMLANGQERCRVVNWTLKQYCY